MAKENSLLQRNLRALRREGTKSCIVNVMFYSTTQEDENINTAILQEKQEQCRTQEIHAEKERTEVELGRRQRQVWKRDSQTGWALHKQSSRQAR